MAKSALAGQDEFHTETEFGRLNSFVNSHTKIRIPDFFNYLKLYSVITTTNVQVEKLSILTLTVTGANWCETEG